MDYTQLLNQLILYNLFPKLEISMSRNLASKKCGPIIKYHGAIPDLERQSIAN